MKTIKYEVLVKNEIKTSDFITPIFDIDFFTGFCAYAKWTPTPTISGSIKIIVSNDKENWIDLEGSEKQLNIAGNHHMWNYDGIAHFRYIRISCKIDFGAGEFFINCNCKGM